MWGQGYLTCDGLVDTEDMIEAAWYCQPVLWGCIWFQQGQMGSGCTYTNVPPNGYRWCPSSGAYVWSNIKQGQLWGVQTEVWVYAADGSYGHDSTFMQVQF